jgi:hypothetical protein
MSAAPASGCFLANDVFSIADDVEISVYTFAGDAFVWSVTRWDNGDKWSAGGVTEAWQTITCSVVSVDTDNGFGLEQGLIRPEPATARVVFTNAAYDPFVNSTVRSGTPIRVRVRPNPDTAPSTWVTLFQGKIDTATASYNYNWVNTVTLECVTDLRDYLNFTAQPPEDGTATITTTTPCYAADYFTAMNTRFGSNLISASGAPALVGYELEGLVDFDPVAYGDIVNQLLDTNAGALIYAPINVDPAQQYFYAWAEIENRTLDPDVIFEAAASAEPLRAEFSDIVIGFDTAEVVNTVNYDTTLGYANTRTNQDSVQLLGSVALDVTTLHYNDADADAWANLLALALPERRVQALTAPVILRAGQVNENLLRDPLDVATVSVNNAQIIIEETYFISRVQHNLTPHSWDTTLNLWKGR